MVWLLQGVVANCRRARWTSVFARSPRAMPCMPSRSSGARSGSSALVACAAGAAGVEESQPVAIPAMAIRAKRTTLRKADWSSGISSVR